MYHRRNTSYEAARPSVSRAQQEEKMTALKISISVLAIAALLGASVVAQARYYRYGYRHSYTPHYSGYSGYRSYYGSSGYSGYYSNSGGGASRAISRLGYDGRRLQRPIPRGLGCRRLRRRPGQLVPLLRPRATDRRRATDGSLKPRGIRRRCDCAHRSDLGARHKLHSKLLKHDTRTGGRRKKITSTSVERRRPFAALMDEKAILDLFRS